MQMQIQSRSRSRFTSNSINQSRCHDNEPTLAQVRSCCAAGPHDVDVLAVVTHEKNTHTRYHAKWTDLLQAATPLTREPHRGPRHPCAPAGVEQSGGACTVPAVLPWAGT